MSPTNERDVSKIVEKYHAECPNWERRFLRRLILAENKNINSRTLDRHLGKLFRQNEQEHKKGPENPSELSPEEQERLNLALAEFRGKYQGRFDAIANTYFSSPEKAWKELREFAATWPEPAKSNFLWAVEKHIPENHERNEFYSGPQYFVEVQDTFKYQVLRALRIQKMAEIP